MAGGNPDFRASDTASYLLGQAGQSGLFNPTGSPAIRRLMRNRAMRNFENRRRRSGILSQLYGLDPNQSRAAMVGSDIAGHGALSQGLMEADYQEATANRPFLQNLLSGQIGYEQQRRMQREAQRAAQRGGIGQLAGGAAGMLLGPIGAAAGGYLGKKFGGGGGRGYNDPYDVTGDLANMMP